MKPRFDSFFSADAPDENFDREFNCHSILVDAYIGRSDGRGEDIFTFRFTTFSNFIGYKIGKKGDTIVMLNELCGFLEREKLIIIDMISRDRLQESLSKIIELCEGEYWESICEKLSKYSDWEFEDEVPYSPPDN